MITYKKITLSHTNCFLLKAEDGYLLIDCGRAGDEHAFLLKLSQMDLHPLSIRYLLLTHHHSDHCGLLPFLLSENPHLRIIMSEKCADYLETGRHFHPVTEQYASKGLNLAMRLYNLAGGQLMDTFKPYLRRADDIILPNQDGALPGLLGSSGRFLHTPGHTEDSISLVIGTNAFAGDAARNMLNFLGSPYEPILYDNAHAFHDSWKKLLSAGVNTIHPGHGRSFPASHLIRR